MARPLSLLADALWFFCAITGAARGQEPARIDLPHPYYYGEMYLPQLTAGPSGAAWSPDSQELIFSRGGALWRQAASSTVARQLTEGSDYDYQPDWSPDGRWVVYSAERHGTFELRVLDLSSGASHALTRGGAVNVEPRWSPDGRRLLFVSTSFQHRFHIFMADFKEGELAGVVRLTGENKSSLPRYYYSAYDHEINPTWTRDGQSILFISNRGRIHGTGGLWRMPASPQANAVELRYEETNWRAKPDMSPDGQRIVYSSYLGRSSLQLWLMPGSGGEPFPITYGEWDDTVPRWSPDGREIAFISNRPGDTEINILRLPGADVRTLQMTEAHRLRPSGTLHLTVRDEHGDITPARVAVTDASGRSYAPEHAWTHVAVFDRDEHPFESRYFHGTGDDAIVLPAGDIRIDVMKGFEREPQRRTVTVQEGTTLAVDAVLAALPWSNSQSPHWVSADVHVHMNYGGTYRNTPEHLVLQAEAEGLDIVENLIVNKEQRFPDIAFSGRLQDQASKADALIVHGQEFHSSYWGHLGLLGLRDHVLLPGYAGYPNTAAASLYPMNADVADLAHAQGALVGYVHPFEEAPQPLTRPAHTDADELPVDVALGKVDYMEIVGFSDHQATAAVWYRLLNLGFRLPAAGGTDAMADYASLRGPVGMNRVYASVPAGPLSSAAWLDALKQGRTFATNGPLLDFSIAGSAIGQTVQIKSASRVAFTARLRSLVPLDHAQIVCNGRVARELPLAANRRALEAAGTVSLASSGWCVLRAFTARAEYPILDNFVYATTSPIYVTVRGAAPRSPEDARFFAAWIQQLATRTAEYPDWNSPQERQKVLDQLSAAKAVYQRLQE